MFYNNFSQKINCLIFTTQGKTIAYKTIMGWYKIRCTNSMFVQNEPGYIYFIYFGVTETLAKLQSLCATHCVISVLCIMIKLFMFLSIDLLKKSVKS